MKKIISTITAVMMCSTWMLSQKEFKKVYELKFPVSVDSWQNNDDQTTVVAGDMSELCGIDAVQGTVLWTLPVKDKLGVKKLESWEYLTDQGVVMLTHKGDKRDDIKTVYLDEKTGVVLTEEQAKRPAKTKSSGGGGGGLFNFKSEWAGSGGLYVENPNVYLDLTYERPAMNGSFGKGKTKPITVSCSGDYNWSSTIQGTFVRSLCDNVVGYGDDFGGDFIDIDTYGNYVFVQYEGLSVLDIKTGKLLWTTTFDFSMFDLGLLKSEMTIGRAPMPVCDETSAYVADLSKDVRALRKFDLATGNKIWESGGLDKNGIITQMIVVDGALIVRNGGEVLVQKLITNANTGAQTCISEMKEEGDFSLNAYDAVSGKTLWIADDLKALGDKFKSISNLIADEKLLYVASEKNLFALDAKSGKAKWKADIDKLKIGIPKDIYFFENDILISAEEGYARVSKADGTVKFGTNTDKNFGAFVRGDVFYVWTGKKPDDRNKFVRFNLNTGAIEGGIEDTYHPYFTSDGNEFIKKDGNVLLRYKTN